MSVDRVNKDNIVNLILNVTRNERKARQWLRFNGLLYRDKYCDNCGEVMIEKLVNSHKDGIMWRCPRNGCQKRISIRKDSFIEGSHLKLMILRIMFYWAWQKPTIDVNRDFYVSQRTIVGIFAFGNV